MRRSEAHPIFRRMRRGTIDDLFPAVTFGLAAAVIPFAAIYLVAHQHVMFSGQTHFVGVGLTALAAALAAVVLTIAGARRRDARTVLVGTAFTAMASLLALHGIATPGILIGMNGVVAFTGGATLPVGAAVLTLSAFPAFVGPGTFVRSSTSRSYCSAQSSRSASSGCSCPPPYRACLQPEAPRL
jgi:hypothetical protein